MPEVAPLSWADKIAAANSAKVKFEAIPLGRTNLEILEASIKMGKTNEYINYKAKIVDGPRANAWVFGRTFPEAKNVSMFIEFIEALGLSTAWLMGDPAQGIAEPSLEQIASALVGRQFSADIYEESDAGTDKNGDKFRSLRKFQQIEDSTPSYDSAPAADQNGGWGQAAQAVVAQPPVQAQVASAPPIPMNPAPAQDNPWGNPQTSGVQSNPFG